MKRLTKVVWALSIALAACGGDDGAATETTVVDTITTTSSAPAGSITTQTAVTETTHPPAAVFLERDAVGPYVTALQTYLECAGFGPVAADGIFGDGTAASVARAQEAEGKEPTGEPDEATFAGLSRSCDRARDIVFAAGATTAEVAGNVAGGDDEMLLLRVLAGQEMTLAVESAGAIQVGIEGADGTVLHAPDGSTRIVVAIPTSQVYTVRVSAVSPSSYSVLVSVPALPTTTTTAAADDDLILAADGLTMVDLGDAPEATLAALAGVLGPIAEDTGWYAGDQEGLYPCAENIREVTWLLPGTEGMMSTTLVVTFHDRFSDDPVFAMWRIFLTFGYDDVQPEPGWFATAHGLSVGDDYAEAVGYGFELGGYEELGDGNLDGIKVSMFSPTGDYETDGQVIAMEAGTWYCDSPDV